MESSEIQSWPHQPPLAWKAQGACSIALQVSQSASQPVSQTDRQRDRQTGHPNSPGIHNFAKASPLNRPITTTYINVTDRKNKSLRERVPQVGTYLKCVWGVIDQLLSRFTNCWMRQDNSTLNLNSKSTQSNSFVCWFRLNLSCGSFIGGVALFIPIYLLLHCPFVKWCLNACMHWSFQIEKLSQLFL